LLLKVVEQAFASSWGDDALAALGEMALESGDCAAARSYWEKIIPAEPPAGASKSWLCFPDTDLELAAIRARLVLVSILEGSPRRAADELAAFERLHGTARGRLGGREVEYAEALAALLGESRAWPRDVAGDDWPTFAGSPGRNRIAAEIGQPVEVAWRIPLPQATLVGRPGSTAAGAIGRVAEDAHARLSFHPVSVGNLLFVGNQAEILAIDSRTGKAAWGPAGTAAYRDQLDSGLQALKNPPDSVGLARFTMTAFEGKLYARMGPAVTSRPRTSMSSGSRGYLVCLDLEAEGRLLWKIEPEDDAWAFEGSPVTDGAGVYVAMRRSEIHPQAHVACFDAASGRRRWRSFVCGAETPARGILHESTHNLLRWSGIRSTTIRIWAL